MKSISKVFATIVGLIVLVGGWLWLRPHFIADSPHETRPHKMHFVVPGTPEERQAARDRMEAIARDPGHDWKSRIDFQGLVVDQDNQPLPDVTVDWETTTTNGNGGGKTFSDGSGRFSIKTTGKVMDIIVDKDGYQSSDGHQGFEFANFTDDNYYDADREHPVLFHLRKMPPAEPIYIWNGDSRRDLINAKTSINPVTGKFSPGEVPGELWVELVPGPQNKPGQVQYNVILGSGGGAGILAVAIDADSIAPETGYTNRVDTQQMIGFDNSAKLQIRAFFKDGASHFGMVDFDIRLKFGDAVKLGYQIKYNPSGGRSLSATEGSEFQINKYSDVHQ